MKKNNKGFTLAELLIVVAIIAVLTAIAIPVFTSQLEKSREATDLSNIRADYAEIQSALLTGDLTQSTSITLSSGHTAAITEGDPSTVGNMKITISNFKVAQKTAGWQTASFDVAGVDKDAVHVNSISSPTSVKFSYTVQSNADIRLTGIDIGTTSST